ncbi:putative lipoprotein, rSAM/lipoprotein system [Mariniphaga anaerophila]|uniref:Putative lipoprotein, rSAM/lipoprotein system n=1 Tax=Mariniphaga anaerophila TaxID=1484053 RepID=A0A1M5GNZ0_9BACT|nr:radical SAM-associated putative lipoprotein [Mariniphaga anaerophila]SHG05368.1 putative lipoprotein, rSAM/lipoprotein system [Mariniphaga anaerophila]
MKTSIFKRFNGLISFFLSVLGFGAACSLSSCEYGTPAVEYGTPYATFKVNGNVKSEVTFNSIPNIRVVMGFDTTFTDESGNYQISNTDFPDDQTFLIEFKDIDGETNGDYQPLDTIVEFIDPEFLGGTGNWDSGETEKEVNVKLKDKE